MEQIEQVEPLAVYNVFCEPLGYFEWYNGVVIFDFGILCVSLRAAGDVFHRKCEFVLNRSW
jgi:hypothetical protein